MQYVVFLMSVEEGIQQHIDCSASSHKALPVIDTDIDRAEKVIGREYMAV